MERRLGIKYLNFMFSFFGLEIIIKSVLAFGTLSSIIDGTGEIQQEPLFSPRNVITMCSIVLFMTEVVFELLACINYKKAEAYSLVMWSLVLGTIANCFYVFFDQGILVGLVFLALSGGMFYINYGYVKRRKKYFGNPDFM